MSNLIDVGQITSAHGIKGWLKVRSLTDPEDNLFSYQPWYLKTKHGVREVELLEWQPQPKGYLIKLKGIEDRTQAENLSPVTIAIDKGLLPELTDGEFYWHQLERCRVVSEYEGATVDLGVVARILATGANDVLVVKGDSQSQDSGERLIPYVPEQFVKAIDLEAGIITVDWDPDF